MHVWFAFCYDKTCIVGGGGLPMPFSKRGKSLPLTWWRLDRKRREMLGGPSECMLCSSDDPRALHFYNLETLHDGINVSHNSSLVPVTNSSRYLHILGPDD